MFSIGKMRPRQWFGAVFAGCLSAAIVQPAYAKTDLVFIVDGSGSISSTDWAIQRNGITAALQDPLVVPRDGSVAVSVVQFSSTTRIEFPYRLIDSEADAQAAINAIQSMPQMRRSTGPGNGIDAATAHLSANGVLEEDFQSYCMSTDGTRNTGSYVGTATNNAKNASFALDRYSVIAIEDPPWFYGSTAQSHYGPHVFGGGAVFVVNNFTQFASFVGALCLGEPLKLVGMEATQVVQDLDNKVTLIEDKTTLVRTYLEPTVGTDPVKATARLKGTRGGTELPGSPLTAVNTGGSITAKPDALDRRNILSDSLNFRLPDSWQSGTVTLELEGVGGTLACEESAGPTANDCMTTVTFEPSSTLDVKLVKVRYDNGTSTIEPSDADLNELERRLMATFPVSDINRTTGTLDVGTGTPMVDSVLSSLETMRFLDMCWNIFPFSCDRYYYGAVDQTGSLLSSRGSATGGKANGIPGTVSAGVIRDGNSYGRNRHGHEIAHTMGRHHTGNGALVGTVVSGGETYKRGPCNSYAEGSAPDFPNIFNVGGSQRATIGPMNSGEDKLVFGWDSQRDSVVDPSATFAMMSYCPGYRWPSDYNYEGIRTKINTGITSLATLDISPLNGTTDQWVLVRGMIQLELGMLDFLPIVSFEVDSGITPPSLPGSDYVLIVLDDQSVELERIPFTPIVMDGDPVDGGGTSAPEPKTGLMMIPVRYNPAAVTYRVERTSDGLLAGVLDASASAPTIEVTFPNGGENLNPPSATFQWIADDADGDSLKYTVQFSPDNGATWETLVTDYADTNLEVNLSDLGKTSTGLFRVQASDGFHTAQDTSDGSFVTPNTPPSCDITKPNDGALFVGVQPIILEAFTSDTEDGDVTTINWSSNINGPIGNGNALITELGAGFVNGVRRLSEGTHTITMSCTDSDGLSDSENIEIEVRLTTPQIKGDADTDGDIDINDLSLIRQDRNKPVDGSSCGSKCDMNDDGVINMLDMRLASLACTRPRCAVE